MTHRDRRDPPSPPLVIALGGNSLLDPELAPTVANQFAVTARAVAPIADLIERGERPLLTHGNGPQVGFMLLRSDLARPALHDVPLDSLVADTQGALGYMIERALREELRTRRLATQVVTMVTEIEVDPGDPALTHPTKPVGGFYDAAEAERLRRERGWALVEDAGRGWRRVVPSPQPLAIVQIETIRLLVAAGVVVIACGGGGIPVTRDGAGHIRGVEGVIDKDRSSALLAREVQARRMIVTTGVEAVYRDYFSERKAPIREIAVEELRALMAKEAFPPGSMGPKLEAAIEFLDRGGEEVGIGHPEALVAIFERRAGTRIFGRSVPRLSDPPAPIVSIERSTNS